MEQKPSSIDPSLKLSQDDLEEFKKIYEEEYGEILSNAEALERAYGLLRLFQVIYRPIPNDSQGPPSNNAHTR